MADRAEDNGGNNDIFVYMGGEQEVPSGVSHLVVNRSVKIIRRETFINCRNLVVVELNGGIDIIEERAFRCCTSLGRINLSGVRVIERCAFACCTALEDVEFGDKLEVIGAFAFDSCTSLKSATIPKIRLIEVGAFNNCRKLVDVELSEDLETVESEAFLGCRSLRRIAMPLKDNMISMEGNFEVFDACNDLSTVDIVGGNHIHKIISSLLLESWKDDMRDVIDRIEVDLPNANKRFHHETKAEVIQQWITSVLERMEHYKAEHNVLLNEAMALLELAVWKAKLDDYQEDKSIVAMRRLLLSWLGKQPPSKKTRIDVITKAEQRIISGAIIVVKNVLPFLKLE